MSEDTETRTIDVDELLAQLTLREKAALCSGADFWHLQSVPRLGVPTVVVADGPHGLRKQRPDADPGGLRDSVPATCFPTAVTLASSWDRDLVREVASAIGEEARAQGVSVVLGPGVNIKRSPLGGRNFEYYSEDPYLSSAMGQAFIEGLQRTGVGACIKHFAANNQETRRLSIDAIVDERALREIYLASFEGSVRAAGPWTVMASYNRLNGTYCAEHQELLTGILRDEWGYEGLVMSDWGAVSDRVRALAAGLDLEMPGIGAERDTAVVRAVRDGDLAQEVLDRAARRVLALIQRARSSGDTPPGYDGDAHHDLARRAAGEGAVLLKNEQAILPLAPDQRLAVIGAFAKHPRYQGAGSSGVTPTRLDVAYDAIAERVTEPEHVTYAPGYRLRGDEVDPELIDEARQMARVADVVVVFAGLPDIHETEGVDRQHMALPAQHDALIEAVAEANPKVVVVLMNGAPVLMPWHGKVPTILEAYLGGQAGGSAVDRLLYGDVNPSGKLAESFPLRLEDHPVHAHFPGGPRTVEYRESVYVGYRYYDTADQDVLFPFGHGLSYTSFAYDGLRLSASRMRDDEALEVTVRITNTGERAGTEVVQLYVSDVESTVFRPQQELKGFEKVSLDPGESKRVTFTLGRRSFVYWDVELHDWQVEGGRFEIRVGSSSRDIWATAQVDVVAAGDRQPGKVEREGLAEYYEPARHSGFSREAFAALYGDPLPPNEPERPGEYTLDTPLADMRGSLGARILKALLRRQAEAAFAADPDNPMAFHAETILREMPLRMMLLSGGDHVTPEMVEGLLDLGNGRLMRGLWKLLRARGKRRASS